MSDLTVITTTSISPRRNRSSSLQSGDDHIASPVFVVFESMDSNKTPSSPLEFHTPNKSLLAPPKNTFRTVKSLPDVTSCPLPGSSNEGAPAGRSVVLSRRGEIRKPPPLLCKSGLLSLQSGWR